MWERLSGWWVEQQATKVIGRLREEAENYGVKAGAHLDKTTFAAMAEKQNAIISQQELKSVATPVFAAPATKPEELFQLKTKSGWLYKEGSKWKTWKKRWFRLSHHLLVYYNDVVEEEKALDLKLIAGIIELQDCTLRETTRKEAGKPVFELYHVHRSLFMYAETEEERVEWIGAFKANCQYKEGIFNRFEQSAQEAEIREARVQSELEETKKALEELQAKTFLEEVHSEQRMAEVRRKEKEIEELAEIKIKLTQTEEDYLQQKELVAELKLEIERLKQESQNEKNERDIAVAGLKSDNEQIKKALQTAQTTAQTLMLELDQARSRSSIKDDSKVTLHVAEEKPSVPSTLEVELQAAQKKILELKEQKKVLIKEVKRLTKT